MARPPNPVTFLARDSYRQRRLRDVAWVLPVAGAVLVSVPLLWPRTGDDLHQTSQALTYLFSVWFGLILFAAGLARLVGADRPAAPPDDKV